MKRIVIAAPHSGSGKTTLTLGIMDALKRRGLAVAPFKVGPDFIDPGYHRLVTGAPSINLDGWMCGHRFVRETFAHHGTGADIAVIEGVMGLFDGIDGVSEAGSTAEVAKLLGAPVLLVVDARSQARSAAALVHGFSRFDPDLKLAGVILNNVASENHERILREALAAGCPDIAVVGCFPKDPGLAIPSRHLGLTTVEDNPLSEAYLQHLRQVVHRSLDVDALLKLAGAEEGEGVGPGGDPSGAGAVTGTCAASVQGWGGGGGKGAGTCGASPQGAEVAKSRGPASPVRIAVARDAAFCFVYPDNLRLLAEKGAELCTFSPLDDAALPDGISGLYLPGGYPELFADRLAHNTPLLTSIRAAIEADLPVYAECGGFIYLTRGLVGKQADPFVGIYPVQTRMLPRRKALGYREVELVADGPIGRRGATARGHEFHYSEMEEMPPQVERLYRVSRKGSALGLEGYRYRNCLASYIHLHFGSAPQLADAFVAHCRTYQSRSGV